MTAARPRIEFFFFIGSTYSYLSVNRAGDLAAKYDVDLVWRPFSLRTLLIEQANSPFSGKPAKMQYMWRDIERRARQFGLPFNGIPPYPVDPDLHANLMAMFAASEGWCEDFAREVYRSWFLEALDPGSPTVLEAILQRLGRPTGLLARVSVPEVAVQLAQNTDRARALGLFGSPSFVTADGELFWGDDRLEDAIDWARRHSPTP